MYLHYRYCVNSSSLEFLAEVDEVDGSEKTEEAEEIHHPATMGGCGPNGICRLPPKTSVQERIEVRAALVETSVNKR